jgi:peroxiredoxin
MKSKPELSQSFINLTPGDPAPWFHQRSTSNPNYAFDTAAGRYIVLCFYGTASDTPGRAAIQSVLTNRQHFDDVRFSFFGVSLDPRDEAEGRVRESMPGIRFFWDSNGAVSRLYGAIPKDAEPGKAPVTARRFWIVLDPTLRVLLVVPFATDGGDATKLFGYLEQLPPPGRLRLIRFPFWIAELFALYLNDALAAAGKRDAQLGRCSEVIHEAPCVGSIIDLEFDPTRIACFALRSDFKRHLLIETDRQRHHEARRHLPVVFADLDEEIIAHRPFDMDRANVAVVGHLAHRLAGVAGGRQPP